MKTLVNAFLMISVLGFATEAFATSYTMNVDHNAIVCDQFPSFKGLDAKGVIPATGTKVNLVRSWFSSEGNIIDVSAPEGTYELVLLNSSRAKRDVLYNTGGRTDKAAPCDFTLSDIRELFKGNQGKGLIVLKANDGHQYGSDYDVSEGAR